MKNKIIDMLWSQFYEELLLSVNIIFLPYVKNIHQILIFKLWVYRLLCVFCFIKSLSYLFFQIQLDFRKKYSTSNALINFTGNSTKLKWRKYWLRYFCWPSKTIWYCWTWYFYKILNVMEKDALQMDGLKTLYLE